MYRKATAAWQLGVTQSTLNKWQEYGLLIIRPQPGRGTFLDGDNIIDTMLKMALASGGAK